MAKSREKVQQQGFWDEEVATPRHDEINAWAYDNADAIFRATYPKMFDRGWVRDDIQVSHSAAEVDTGHKIALKTFLEETERPNPRIARRTWEYVLQSGGEGRSSYRRVVGYADLVFHTVASEVVSKWDDTHKQWSEIEFEIATNRRDWPSILVESKSEIPSVGNLIRQLRLYQTAFAGRMVVVSPDATHEGLLAEQGFTFVRYPGN